MHFHGRLNKSSDGVCWFLDRGGCGEGEEGRGREAGGENWLCSGGGLVLPLLRWYSTIERGWVAVAGGPFGLGWTLRGGQAKLQRDSLTPFVAKVPTLLMHYADWEGRESDDSDEGGKEGFLIGERLTGLGGGCGRRPRHSSRQSVMLVLEGFMMSYTMHIHPYRV